jgi:hypothetical protein
MPATMTGMDMGTATGTAAMATSTAGMSHSDMGMGMGGGNSCKISVSDTLIRCRSVCKNHANSCKCRCYGIGTLSIHVCHGSGSRAVARPHHYRNAD